MTGSLPPIAPPSSTQQSDLTEPLTSAPESKLSIEQKEADKSKEDRLSHAGLSHSIKLSTKYYETEVPIWVDEYIPASSDDSEDPTGVKAWANVFSSAEAKEVVDALGAVIVTFRKPVDAAHVAHTRANMVKEIEHIHGALIKQFKRKNDAGKSTGILTSEDKENEDDSDEFDFIDWDGICLAVAVPADSAASADLEAEDWEVAFQPFGFEFVDLEKSGRNDYGELQGLARIREALETFGWQSGDSAGKQRLEGYDEFDSDLEEISRPQLGDSDNDAEFDQQLREMQMEMAALHFAIDSSASQANAEDDDGKGPIPENDIEEIERIMQRMKEVRRTYNLSLFVFYFLLFCICRSKLDTDNNYLLRTRRKPTAGRATEIS